MTTEKMKVGELARRSGLTVRTLHYWDEIGLLRPSHHTAAGHRLYLPGDVARLHQIRSLRLLGFALEDVGKLLAGPEPSFAQLIRAHVGKLDAQIELARRLKTRLEGVVERLETSAEISVDDLLHNLELMDMYEKYYDQEQLAALEARRKEMGEDAIAAVQQEWPKLIADVRALIDAGVAPEDPRAAPLAKRYGELIRAFTGGDPGIARSLQNMYQQEPAMQQQQGLDAALFAWVRKAQEAAGGA